MCVKFSDFQRWLRRPHGEVINLNSFGGGEALINASSRHQHLFSCCFEVKGKKVIYIIIIIIFGVLES